MNFDAQFQENTKALGSIAENGPVTIGGFKEVEGIGSGRKVEWDAFWDDFQANGTRVNYQHAFVRWSDITFKPKYDLKPTNAQNLFYSATVSEASFNDALNRGVKFDFSKSINMAYAFCSIKAKEIAFDVSLESVTSANNVSNLFGVNPQLETIKKIIPHATASIPFTFFNGCTSLKNVRIGGTIRGNVNLQDCPITLDTAKDIILHLKDCSADGAYSLTCTFSGDTWALLDADEGYQGSTWREFVEYGICWNI